MDRRHVRGIGLERYGAYWLMTASTRSVRPAQIRDLDAIRALLRSLAVPPEARGEGIGLRLLEALERDAVQAGIGGVYLLTTTAAGFFEVHGYERMAQRALPLSIQNTEAAAHLCPDRAVCMQKRLCAADE
jgi:N-acetylglutamate synthase-like GNAT family acetyltransferase